MFRASLAYVFHRHCEPILVVQKTNDEVKIANVLKSFKSIVHKNTAIVAPKNAMMFCNVNFFSKEY